MGFRRSEMKKTKWIVALLSVALVVGMVALVAVSCGGGGGGGDEETTTTAQVPTTVDPGTTYKGDDALVLSMGMPTAATLYKTYLKPWMGAITAASNGRVEFNVQDNNSLCKEEQQVDTCLSGGSDLVAFQPAWNTGRFPLLELAIQPMVFPNQEVANRVMWDLINEFGQDQFPGFHVLGIMMVAPANYAGNREVRVPDDLKGMTIRADGAVEVATVRALGGTPKEAATGDLPAMISQEAFDGFFMSWSFHAWMTNQWATNWTESAIYFRPLLLVMNEKKWNSLPAAVQKAFDDNSGIEASVKYNNTDAAFQLDNSSHPELAGEGFDRKAVAERAKDIGSEIVELTLEERALWTAALDPVLKDNWIDRYAGRLPTQAIADRMRELVQQYYQTGGATTTTAAK
jgi:TRAP-type C4-dicarboxylate transport system substrate-binding protein